MNSSIEKQILPGKGRTLVAIQPISAGEVILEEIPYAFIITTPFLSVTCSNCCRICNNETVYKVNSDDNCCYCSQECLSSDYLLHQLEITAAKTIHKTVTNNSDIEKYKLVCKTACQKVIDKKNNSIAIKKEELVSGFDYSVSTFHHIMQLQPIDTRATNNNDIEKDFQTKAQQVTKIAFVSKVQLTKNESVHILKSIPCNAHCIVNDLSQSIAIGLFPHTSMINHSCSPNCTKYFVLSNSNSISNLENVNNSMKPKLVIRATKDIVIGEEITYSYIPLYQSTKSRKRILFDTYGFDCNCNRCSNSIDDGYIDLVPAKVSGKSFEEETFAALEKLQQGRSVVDYLTDLVKILHTFQTVSMEHKLILQSIIALTSIAISILKTDSNDSDNFVVDQSSNNCSPCNLQYKNLQLVCRLGLVALGCIYKHIPSIEIECVDLEYQLSILFKELAIERQDDLIQAAMATATLNHDSTGSNSAVVNESSSANSGDYYYIRLMNESIEKFGERSKEIIKMESYVLQALNIDLNSSDIFLSISKSLEESSIRKRKLCR